MSTFCMGFQTRASQRRRFGPIFAAVFALALMPAAVAEARETCPGDGITELYRSSVQTLLQKSCPCGDPPNRKAYRRCAADLTNQFVDWGIVEPACREKVTREARRSTCGKPETVVCCAVKLNGENPHRLVRGADRCRSTASETRCISQFSSVAAGCDANGCTAPICGNRVIEDGETCDPPVALLCDRSCHVIACEDVPPSCGNLALDDGETCEPPGVGDCARDCQSAACSAPQPGETAVACAETPADSDLRVDATASAAGYLLVWNAAHRRPSEILARRLNVEGLATEEAAIEVSAGEPCGTLRADPAVGSDGNAWYVVWTQSGENPPTWDGRESYTAVHGLRLDFTGGRSEIHEFDRLIDPNHIHCSRSLLRPSVARASRTAISWAAMHGCWAPIGLPAFWQPFGVEVAFEGTQPLVTPVVDGFDGAPASFPLHPLSTGPAVLDSSPATTLWVWPAYFQGDAGRSLLTARWNEGSELSPLFELTTHRPSGVRPSLAVAAGSTSFLVTWAEGASDFANRATRIRSLRVSRMDGRLDPDGGILLATAPGGVVAGPDAVFDGGRWLVAWVEATASGNELRAVAVETDGSVVDSAPRLLAGGVAASDPSLASRGDGRVLVAFTRDEGELTAVRSILVDP